MGRWIDRFVLVGGWTCAAFSAAFLALVGYATFGGADGPNWEALAGSVLAAPYAVVAFVLLAYPRRRSGPTP